MYFHIDGKSAQADKRVKSRIINKFIFCVLSIDAFEQQFIVIKSMLQSPHLKYHVKNIGIEPSLSNSAIF